MYELETMKYAVIAHLEKRPSPLPTPDTGHKPFDAAWQFSFEILGDERQNYLSRWKSASNYVKFRDSATTAAEHYVKHATRFVAISYILCAQELAAKDMGKPIVSMLETSKYEAPPGDIMRYTTHIVDAAEDMHAYLKTNANTKDIHPGSVVRDSIKEFYSLAIVALHETRVKADASFQKTIDDTIDACIDQLINRGMQPVIPINIGNQIKARRFMRAAETIQREAPPPQQQQPQWQPLLQQRSAPAADTRAAKGTKDDADFGAVVLAATREDGVTSLVDLRKRMLARRAGQNLVNKQGGPDLTDPQ